MVRAMMNCDEKAQGGAEVRGIREQGEQLPMP
jgi:hypothetical protein